MQIQISEILASVGSNFFSYVCSQKEPLRIFIIWLVVFQYSLYVFNFMYIECVTGPFWFYGFILSSNLKIISITKHVHCIRFASFSRNLSISITDGIPTPCSELYTITSWNNLWWSSSMECRNVIRQYHTPGTRNTKCHDKKLQWLYNRWHNQSWK